MLTPSIVIRKLRRVAARAAFMRSVIGQYRALGRHPRQRFTLRWTDRWLHLRDATSTTAFDRHYVFHTAWAARILAETGVREHVDVASSLYFATSASAFLKIQFIDFRPAQLGLSNLDSRAGTLMSLPFADSSLSSVSCMHVVEHVGLGRYGDSLDYEGDLKAVAELARVVSSGGQLLLVVPVGGEARIQFNAHRIYTYRQVVDMLPSFSLHEFALIPDDGAEDGLIRHAAPELADRQRYGCGCFHFVKANE
jgi:hypothetical protein